VRRQLKAILIIGTILIAAAVSLSIVLPYFKQSQPTTSKGLVYIYVQSSIYSGLTPEI